MKNRFCKQSVADFIRLRIKNIQDEWDFDPDNGTVQIERANTDMAVAYGEYDALNALADEFALPGWSR